MTGKTVEWYNQIVLGGFELEQNEAGSMQGIMLISVGVVVLLLIIAMAVYSFQRQENSNPADDSNPSDNTSQTDPSSRPDNPEPDDYAKEVALRQPDKKTYLSCDSVAVYSGAFLENGSDEPVENVASMLITNHSGRFLEYAKLTYEIDGRTAFFVVTGLHDGQSAWVLESTGMSVNAESRYVYVDAVTSYLEHVVRSAEELEITYVRNMLKVTNIADRTLENVTVYYKVVDEDSHYFGGITYVVNFGSLAPGDSVEKIAGHYQENRTVIVRVGWQETNP